MLYLNDDPKESAHNIIRKYGFRAQEFIMFEIKRCQEIGCPEQVDGWKSISAEVKKISAANSKKK